MSESAQAIAAQMTMKFEGFSPSPYQDSVGVWTIGYGSTKDKYDNPVTSSTPSITESDAMQLLLRDMKWAFDDIRKVVKVPLSDDEEAAIADMIYNVGAAAFNGSQLLQYLNEKDYKNAAIQFLLWDHAGGKVLAGLMVRCWARMTTFISGES